MNTRTICNWVVLVFYFTLQLLAVSANQVNRESAGARTLKQVHEASHDHEVHCSRERSKAAWQIIEEYLMPVVEKERYQISKSCKLHPENNLYRDQEQHKAQVDIYEWQCGYCRKSFYDEKFLDRHMDNRHYNLLNVSSSKCLADLCGALHCDLVLDTTPRKTKCNPAAAARNKHLCESLANSCFSDSEGPSASRLHQFFLRQFCDAHSCTGKQKPFSKGRRKRIHISYVVISILTLMLLPLIYTLIYLYQKGIRTGTQQFKRIMKSGGKKKSY
jgi:hypothetical protein